MHRRVGWLRCRRGRKGECGAGVGGWSGREGGGDEQAIGFGEVEGGDGAAGRQCHECNIRWEVIVLRGKEGGTWRINWLNVNFGWMDRNGNICVK